MNTIFVMGAIFLTGAIFLNYASFELERKIDFTVHRNIQETFNYLSNPENNQHWLSGVTKIKKNTPSEIKVGTVFEFQRKVMERVAKGTIKIVNLDAGKQFGYQSVASNYRFRLNYTFEKTGENETHVVFNVFGGLRDLLISLCVVWFLIRSSSSLRLILLN